MQILSTLLILWLRLLVMSCIVYLKCFKSRVCLFISTIIPLFTPFQAHSLYLLQSLIQWHELLSKFTSHLEHLHVSDPLHLNGLY